MKTALVTLLFFASFALLSAQHHHPKFPEEFHARVIYHVHDREGNFSGPGIFAAHQRHGKSVERFETVVHHNHISTEILERFDLGRGYEITRDVCHSWHLSHHMPETWAWLRHAEFKGKHHHHGKTCDLWESREHGHAILSVLVDEHHPDAPVWFQRESAHRVVSMDFTSFEEGVHEGIFNIPHRCNETEMLSLTNPPSVGCVGRSTMIKRAQNWVDHHVPYSQSGTYEGYRTDCSGYASMAWGLGKPGLTTRTLGGVSHKISKNDLKEGDVLLNVAEHVVIFGGWSDSSRSHYIAYEETRPGVGTVKRVTPYPYWYSTNAFIPYRYNSVC